MRKSAIVLGAIVMIGAGPRLVSSHAAELPAGPIRDRHELMEGMSKNAKFIDKALKVGGGQPGIEDAALKIMSSANKIPGLFPQGSTNPKSRAKPAIWTHWDKFQENARLLSEAAGVTADRARSGGDIKPAADKMFSVCKSCHDEFREPKKKTKH